MNRHKPRKPADDPAPPKLSCRECQLEIPPDEAFISQATDYALYFCGVGCFDRWRKRAAEEISYEEAEKRTGASRS